MKNYYQFYLAEKEKLVAEKKATIDARIKKARKDSVIISYLLQEEKDSISSLQKELQKISLGNFLPRLHEIQIFDAEISEEDAFIQCLTEFKIENADNTIKKLAATKASDEIIQYCYFLMNSKSRNRSFSEALESEKHKNKYWMGNEETEFVQLMYALVQTKRLEEKGKVKMVEQIASFLGFPLSYDWQSKLSHSIHDRNGNTIPGIFNELKDGWLSYRSDQIEKKKKSR